MYNKRSPFFAGDGYSRAGIVVFAVEGARTLAGTNTLRALCIQCIATSKSTDIIVSFVCAGETYKLMSTKQ